MYLNKSETKVLEMIERFGHYVACSYEKRNYNAAVSLIRKGLVSVTSPETFKISSYTCGERETWYEFDIEKIK